MGDSKKALDYLKRSIRICRKMNNDIKVAIAFHIMGLVYHLSGDYDNALKYMERSLKMLEEVDSFRWTIFLPLFDLGRYNFDKGVYDKAIEYLEKSIVIQRKVEFKGDGCLLWATTFLFLSYKKVGRKYDESIIHSLINENDYIQYDNSFALYQLLEDTS